MSELVWDIKNGELDSVKNEIEKKVIYDNSYLTINILFFSFMITLTLLSATK